MSAQQGKWLLVTYRPVSLFSLRMTVATSSGAKTLLVPTPYAFKLAAVDAAFRVSGEGLARRVLEWVKALDVRFLPPEHAVVTHTFVKIRRQPKAPTPEEPYISSIAFREFCSYRGDLVVGMNVSALDSEQVTHLIEILAHVNYLGKRGSFFQYLGAEQVGELPPGFTVPVSGEPVSGEVRDINAYAVTQFLDDLAEVGAKDLFERISTYSDKSISKHRTLKPYLLPYRLIRSSRSYTHFRRSAGGTDG